MLISVPRGRDILECIASLSSDEVATPPAVANQVLDLLPAEVWSNKDLRWLDPGCKTGVFLREAARRLMEGLKSEIPNETERRTHIFTKMLYGYALTELTAQMSRRTLYYNKDASNQKLSVVPFKDEKGNIYFSGQDHSYSLSGRCEVCGAGRAVFGGSGSRERHAYDFIHSREDAVRFDVIVGNPPYQIEDGGAGASATPIYQHFVTQAFRMRPRYVAMIIPSRWFASGKGLSGFREQMLKSKNFSRLEIFENEKELFPNVTVEGGVCYFLWDAQYVGPCQVSQHSGGKVVSSASRYLNQHGETFVQWNEAISILEKVQALKETTYSERVSGRNPFGFATNYKNFFNTPAGSHDVKIFANKAVGYISRDEVSSSMELIDKWKVLTSVGYGAGGDSPSQVINRPIIAPPGSVCTDTYIVLDSFDNEAEAKMFVKYYSTRLFRFLVALRKNTQHVTRSRFSFVPVLQLSEEWSDSKLSKRYKLTENESAFIASKVREMADEPL